MTKYDFSELNKYTLTNELFTKFTQQKHSNTNLYENKHSNIKKIEKSRYIIPQQKDKLFWCFYILHKGIEDYKLIKDKHFSIEKKIKIDFINIIRDNKTLLKRYKLSRNAVEDVLVNENKIDIKVFFMLCIYYEIDIMFINRNFYYEIEELFTDKLNVIRVINDNFCIDTEIENLDFYRNNYCKMVNIDRYLKAMSTYKLDELQDMCLKLDIIFLNENNKKKTKQELYNNILLLLA